VENVNNVDHVDKKVAEVEGKDRIRKERKAKESKVKQSKVKWSEVNKRRTKERKSSTNGNRRKEQIN